MPRTSAYRDSVNIAAVERALKVMEVICYEEREMGVNEIASKMGDYPSTIYRVIATLVAHGYLYQNPESNKYGLNYKVVMLGKNVEENSTLIRISKPYADAIAAEFKENVNVGIREEEEYWANTIYQAKGGKRTLSVSESVGQAYRCYYSSIGKALLAFSEDLDYSLLRTERIEQYTPNTITDPEKMIEELETIRKQGYAIDNEEQELGLYCIGCPVLDHKGHAVLALSISGYERNIKAHGVERIISSLKAACEEMSRFFQ